MADDNRTDEQRALDDESRAVQDEAQALQDQDRAEANEEQSESQQGSQLPGQGEPVPASESDQATRPNVAPGDLVATNTGVDLTATDTGTNPQVKQDQENTNLTAAEQAVRAADPTPVQEALAAGSNVDSPVGNPTPLQSEPQGMPIDASGLNVTTNQDVVDAFPRNENGQVVIDETGRVQGLDDAQQPSPANITSQPQEGGVATAENTSGESTLQTEGDQSQGSSAQSQSSDSSSSNA